MTCAAIWNSFMKMSGGAEIEGEKCDERDFNSSRSESGQACPWLTIYALVEQPFGDGVRAVS